MDFCKKNRITGVTRRDIFDLLSYGKDEEVFDTIAPAINGVEPQSTKRPQSLCVLCDLCG